jgi:Family of unknown function (DUF5681)
MSESSSKPPKDPEEQSEGYEVGYGKPPLGTRFKKGQSGNSKGRPKQIKSLQAEINRELKQKVAINENGRKKKITKRQAIVKRLINDAINGNSSRLLLSYLMECEEELTEKIIPVGRTNIEKLSDLSNRLRARLAVQQRNQNI